jgi:SAM-dependent methyltransferase/uncharacterized protein YbaR (Trm112 family)
LRREALTLLACPACRAPFDLDPLREEGGEVLEAFLVCSRCREVRAVVGGVAVVPRDWAGHLRADGNVHRRSRVHDPRMARFLFGTASDGADVVPFEEVVERYGDLAPEAARPPASEDVRLEAALAEVPAGGRGLDLGCGVGRGTFLLAARLGEAIGVDPSLARLRRARNIATTREPFLVPSPAGGRDEVALDLARLARDGTAFAAADGDALPFADGVFDVVVLREARWPDPGAVRAEAERVRAPGGRRIVL